MTKPSIYKVLLTSVPNCLVILLQLQIMQHLVHCLRVILPLGSQSEWESPTFMENFCFVKKFSPNNGKFPPALSCGDNLIFLLSVSYHSRPERIAAVCLFCWTPYFLHAVSCIGVLLVDIPFLKSETFYTENVDNLHEPPQLVADCSLHQPVDAASDKNWSVVL